MAEQRRNLKIEEIEVALLKRSDPDLAEALTDFGEVMLDEVRDRSYQLDAKAMTILGYAGAIFALLLIGNGKVVELSKLTFPETGLLAIGTCASLIAIVCGLV